jgi:hypothetical protein
MQKFLWLGGASQLAQIMNCIFDLQLNEKYDVLE